MKLPLKERVRSAAVIIPTAVLIVALAALQFRWSNAASNATGIRLADSLHLSMINWHLDFFRNFSEVCLMMRVDPKSSAAGDDANPFMRGFAEWKAVARYPDLVSNVYLVKLGPAANPPAIRLNPATRRFEPSQWPVSLMPLRRDLERASSDVAPLIDAQATGPQLAESFYNIGAALRGWRFEPGIPALLYPMNRGLETSARDSRTAPDAVDWIVVELNSTVIQSRILPDLAHRYFQGTDGLDYEVAVVSGSEPRRVIYSSHPGFGDREVADADGRLDVFGRAGDKTPGSTIDVFWRPSPSRSPTAAVGTAWFPLLREAPEEQDWQLVVRHLRGGPLGVFVAGMYRRDLAISFGALLLLVLSIAMLIVSTNRAHRLARLQMDFVTAVSHELRTPLTVISSAADNIAHGVVEGKEQLKQYGSVIGNQVRQLAGLVDQILLFAATRDGRQRYSLQPLRVAEIIEATLASTEELIRAAQFTVEQEIDPSLPPVTGDLVALSQCLQNLMTNALKYDKSQRWMAIRASLAQDDSGGPEIQVSISDRGIGIDPADLPHIFEPFYRSQSTAAAQTHGTGLGLSLAKRIAEAMKGRLTVTSVPGRGSTFTLHLPCAEPPSGDTAVETNAPAAHPSQHLHGGSAVHRG